MHHLTSGIRAKISRGGLALIQLRKASGGVCGGREAVALVH